MEKRYHGLSLSSESQARVELGHLHYLVLMVMADFVREETGARKASSFDSRRVKDWKQFLRNIDI